VSTLLDAIAEAKRRRAWPELSAAVPYARFLGITMDDASGELLAKMPFSPHLVGNSSLPALHGGTLGALLESVSIFQLLWEIEEPVLPKTINITIDYMRSGRPLDTWAKATVSKLGRRVASVHAEAWQEDRARPIASARAHFLVLGPAEGGDPGTDSL
jgi:uncharacterized protein (TIGR00369 family)